MKRISVCTLVVLTASCALCVKAADDVATLSAKAAKAYQSGQYRQAADTLSRAIKGAPERADLRHKRGVAQLQQRDADAALPDFMKAVQLDAFLAPAWNGLGAAQYLKSDYASARASLDRALELQPADPLSHLNRGLVCLEQGDIAEASGSLQRSAQLAPADPRTQAALVRLQEKQASAMERREQAAKDPTAGLANLMATLSNAYLAANELRTAATHRDLGSAINGLGRLGGMLAKKKTAQAKSQISAPGPFALDASGRMAPALAYDTAPAEALPVPSVPPSAPPSAPAGPSSVQQPAVAEAPPAAQPAPASASPQPEAAAPSYAADEAAIQQRLAQLSQALAAKNLDAAMSGFSPAISEKVREAFSGNPERMKPFADMLSRAKLTLLSEQTAPDADGAVRRGELTLSSADRTLYLQMAKIGDAWLVSSI